MMGRYIISGIRAARDDTSHKPEKARQRCSMRIIGTQCLPGRGNRFSGPNLSKHFTRIAFLQFALPSAIS